MYVLEEKKTLLLWKPILVCKIYKTVNLKVGPSLKMFHFV